MSIIVIHKNLSVILYDTNKNTSSIHKINFSSNFEYQISADNKYALYRERYTSYLVELNNKYPFEISDHEILNQNIYAISYDNKVNSSDNIKFSNDSKYLISCHPNKYDYLDNLCLKNHYFKVLDITDRSICYISNYYFLIQNISVTDNSLMIQAYANVIVFDINTFTKLFSIPLDLGYNILLENLVISKAKLQIIDLSTGLKHEKSIYLHPFDFHQLLLIDNKLYKIYLDKIITVNLENETQVTHLTQFTADNFLLKYNFFVTDNKIYDNLTTKFMN